MHYLNRKKLSHAGIKTYILNLLQLWEPWH